MLLQAHVLVGRKESFTTQHKHPKRKVKKAPKEGK
jgi:hypothetical protein